MKYYSNQKQGGSNMNTRVFNNGKPKVQKFSLDEVFIADDESQVRQGDRLSSHVRDLENQIAQRGQEVPITVGKPITDRDSQYFGLRPIYDGNHRYTAKTNILADADWDSLTPEERKELSTIKAVVKSFKNVEQLENYQLDCNEHSVSQTTTESDYSVVLLRRMKNPRQYKPFPYGITFNNFGTRTKNDFDVIVDYCKKLWKLNAYQAKKVVKAALDKHPAAKLRSYTRAEATKFFSKDFLGTGVNGNTVRWLGKKASEESNGYVPYFLGSVSHVFPNLAGGSFLSKTINSTNTTVAVFYDANTWGTSAKGLLDYRERALEKVNKINTSGMLRDDLVNEVVFLPQLKTEQNLIYAKRNANGEFII